MTEARTDIEHQPNTVDVTVTFPLAHGQPFHQQEPPAATVATVREQAMAQFGIQQDPNSAYYLTHDGARVDDSALLQSVAGTAHAVKFTLVKELIQG